VHTLFTGQRERKRKERERKERERERKKRERVRVRKSEKEGERERKREIERCRTGPKLLFLFLKGMMGAFAPFSYLVIIDCQLLHLCFIQGVEIFIKKYLDL
jgi:hypothetical protein